MPRKALVTEAIDGLLRTAGGKLARLDGYPHIKVVVRTDWDRVEAWRWSRAAAPGTNPATPASSGRAC
jgi:hypothetical protein